MKITDLIPWGKRDVPARRDGTNAVHALQADLNRVFDDFWRAFDLPSPGTWGTGFDAEAAPRIDVRETAKQVEVLAELPGMEEKDVDVRVAEGTLTITGEKKSERETEEKGYVLRERSFGRFERVVPLPDGLDVDAAKATFKNGVLTITIPKTAEAQTEVKHIQVQRA
jgi:HSP20 family protein